MTADRTQGLWVESDALPDGTYGVSVSVNGDRTWPLDRSAAMDYAAAVVKATTTAEHDAAVINLARNRLRLNLEAAAALLVPMRQRRPARIEALPRLWLTPCVGERAGPFVQIHVGDENSLEQAGECTPTDLRDHAAGVLAALAVVELDEVTRDILIAEFGLDAGGARQFVGTLAEHWPAAETPRRIAS